MRVHEAESKSQVAAFLASYIETIRPLAAEFRALAKAAGVELDDSVASLKPANRFFLSRINDVKFESPPPLPLWWDPEVGTKEDSAEFPFDRHQLKLINHFQAYVAEVVVESGAARWGVFKGMRREYRNGTPVLIFDGDRTLNAVGFVYGEALKKLRDDPRATEDYVFEHLDSLIATP